MAEALGTVASILQLVDTALRIREHIQDFRQALQDQQKLLSELDDLRPLLNELQTRIAGNPANTNLQNMKSPLADFEVAMKELVGKLNPVDGRFAKLWKQLKWSLEEKKEAQETLRRFGDFKLLLNSWLVIDLWDVGQRNQRDNAKHFSDMAEQRERNQQAITVSLDKVNSGILEQQGRIDSVGHSVNNVANKVDVGNTGIVHISDMQERERRGAERTKIIDWFSPINFFLRHADIARARQAGTGEWFLAEPHFQEWESGSGRTLWCPGIPGAGKTVLASMVVDHLRVRAKSKQENIGVGCIYLNHKEAGNQTPDNLLSGLWRQLVRGRDVGSLAKEIYEGHLEERTPPLPEEVVKVLRSSFTHFSKIYLIVDAVDEYPEDKRWILLGHLAKLNSANLMITSRPQILPDPFSFSNLETLDIHAREEDLQTYVNAQIDSSSRLSKHVHKQPSLRADIHLKINDHTVDGMFLLAKLHIESLSTKNTITGVREALKHLPKSLDDSYDIAMQRIEAQNEEDRKTAHSALTWVANARRPLTVSEITVALAIEPGARQLDEENILDIEIILAVCAGLVIVDERLSVVRLVHYTTQKYLDSIQAERFPDAQTEITHTLLTLLAFDGFPDSSWSRWNIDLPPLIKYSQYCLAHAAGRPEGQLRNMLLEFLGHTHQWEQVMRRKWSAPPWGFSDWPSQPSVLWIAAAANLAGTVKFLLKEAPMNKHPDGAGIIAASYYGHLEMVQLLVENGADVNTPTKRHGPPLSVASETGHDRIVQFLLKNGANVNVHGGGYGSALHTALAKKNEKIARMLIKNGADVNLQGKDGGALTTAVWYGMVNIVLLLLERGVDMNAHGGRYNFALHTALASGHEQIARVLIDNGADVNLQGEDGGALTTASRYGMENIVVLLLKQGADVNAQGGPQHFALHTALVYKHEKIAQLLIENGADVNLQSGWHSGALTIASCYGMANMVSLLLERGADVNARSGRYGSALHTALAEKHEKIARLLIENGADVNSQGWDGAALTKASCYGMDNIVVLLLERGAHVNARGGLHDFPLHAALAHKQENIARLLIENGADVNALCRHLFYPLELAAGWADEDLARLLINKGADLNACYRMSLWRASRDGNENAVRLLLENGADLDLIINHWSPIATAASGGHEGIVRLLIEHGATADAPGGQYGVALVEASDAGHATIVEALVDNGADVNTHDGDHRTALATASRAGHERIVQFLLDNGVDVNTQDGIYGSAIEAASRGRNKHIVELLIRHGAIVPNPEECFGSESDQGESTDEDKEAPTEEGESKDEEESTDAEYFTDEGEISEDL
ncbi:ankyrin repeat-containing domain protein [Mycena vulgaris]|nr:ankyrin repeat-containing domain protein [Mycena vulgaris]